ncbi:unnamed protein product [Parnassius apollo]|uniref:(apollo) hypothetical protein n=1 Tax=Parnassius apollo TaxID=110799 RepID=A0A8S3XDB0_PARAO|nr:unnamed protein product [Parnassius apollo]
MNQEIRHSWKCPKCHSKQPKTDNTNSPLRQPLQSTQPGRSNVSVLDETSCEASNVTIRARQQSQAVPVDHRYVTEDSLRRILSEELSCMMKMRA